MTDEHRDDYCVDIAKCKDGTTWYWKVSLWTDSSYGNYTGHAGWDMAQFLDGAYAYGKTKTRWGARHKARRDISRLEREAREGDKSEQFFVPRTREELP